MSHRRPLSPGNMWLRNWFLNIIFVVIATHALCLMCQTSQVWGSPQQHVEEAGWYSEGVTVWACCVPSDTGRVPDEGRSFQMKCKESWLPKCRIFWHPGVKERFPTYRQIYLEEAWISGLALNNPPGNSFLWAQGLVPASVGCKFSCTDIAHAGFCPASVTRSTA